MRKSIITLALMLIVSLSASAQTTKRVVTDSVAFMPSQVQIKSGISSKGNPTYWIEIPAENGIRKVSMSESHATSNRLLALIERRDEKGKYSYSIKFAQRKTSSGSGRADLSALKSL